MLCVCSEDVFKSLVSKTLPLIVTLVALAAAAPPFVREITFADATAGSGLDRFRTTYGTAGKSTYILETTGTGVAFADFDNDGILDVFMANGSTLEPAKGATPRSALFKGKGDGTFVDVTDKAGVGRSGWGQGVAAADFDNDGFEDLYLTYFGRNVLLRNKGDATFEDVTEKAGVAAGGWSTGSAFADDDNDGDLDLYVARYVDFDPARAALPGSAPNCRYRGAPVMCGPRGLAGAQDILYRNNGDGTFTDVTAAAGNLDKDRLRGLGVVWGDYDDDGDVDLFVANDAHANLVYRNDGKGTFTEVGFESGVAFDEDGRERAGMGIDIGDYDNDGRLDLVITNFFGEPNALYRNQGSGQFAETTWPAGIGNATMRFLGWGTRFVDFDGDSWRDLLFVNGHVYPEVDQTGAEEHYAQRALVFRNGGDGRFTDASSRAGDALKTAWAGRGAAFGDYDNDGAVDVLISTINGPPVLLKNESRGNHWLSIRLRGVKSNRDGFGARVVVDAGGRRLTGEAHGGGSYLSESDHRLHFGLGGDTTARTVEVRWPSGARQRFKDVPGDRALVIDEVAGIVTGKP